MKILKRIKGLVESLTIIDRYLAEHNAPFVKMKEAKYND